MTTLGNKYLLARLDQKETKTLNKSQNCSLNLSRSDLTSKTGNSGFRLTKLPSSALKQSGENSKCTIPRNNQMKLAKNMQKIKKSAFYMDNEMFEKRKQYLEKRKTEKKV